MSKIGKCEVYCSYLSVGVSGYYGYHGLLAVVNMVTPVATLLDSSTTTRVTSCKVKGGSFSAHDVMSSNFSSPFESTCTYSANSCFE